MRSFLTLSVLLFTTISYSTAQNAPDPRLQWWQESRFGMFIHWGPISLKGTEIGWSRGREIPAEEYDQLYRSFDPEKFSAAKWVKLAKEAGMNYMVLTAKHHDGFCLWDTKTTSYNIMNTPFGRDVVKELADECRKEGIIFCTYYSILDWRHPDYNPTEAHGGPGFALPEGQSPDMARYIDYMYAQLKELIQNYGPLGILWFDGEWEDPWTHEMGQDLYRYVRSLQEDIIINNRVDKGRKGMQGSTLTDKNYAGDYDTPEQEVGKFQTDRPWESCMTIATQWAWKPDDKLKSFEDCIRILVQTVGGDGNLLLNVGPKPGGEIEEEQADRLREIGQWLGKYGESIYGTRGGPFLPEKWGVSTHKNNKIYLHLLEPKGKTLKLPAVDSKIVRCYLMDGNEELGYTQSKERVQIQLAKLDNEKVDNVVVLELEE